MNIITNNHARPMVCLADLPAKVQKDFDYITGAYDGKLKFDLRFVQYKGCWYDVDDSQAVRYSRGGSAMTEFDGWDSFVSDSFFSGVLFKLCDDDTVIVGRYCV